MSTEEESKQPQNLKAMDRNPVVLPVAKDHPRAAERPAQPIRPLPPRTVSPAKRKIGLILFSVVLPLALLALVIVVVMKLDSGKQGLEEVSGGALYWVADGVVAVQRGPEPGQKMYYLVEAPRESNPRVTLHEGGVTVRARTDEGIRIGSRPLDWTEGSKVLLFTFKNYFREPVELEGDLKVLEQFEDSGGLGGSVAQLLFHFRVAAPGAPAPEPPSLAPIPSPAPTPAP